MAYTVPNLRGAVPRVKGWPYVIVTERTVPYFTSCIHQQSSLSHMYGWLQLLHTHTWRHDDVLLQWAMEAYGTRRVHSTPTLCITSQKVGYIWLLPQLDIIYKRRPAPLAYLLYRVAHSLFPSLQPGVSLVILLLIIVLFCYLIHHTSDIDPGEIVLWALLTPVLLQLWHWLPHAFPVASEPWTKQQNDNI